MSTPESARAGDLSFSLDGADVIDLRWGGLDLASRIQVTVRDPGWGTVPARLRSRTVVRVDGGVHVGVEASHDAVGFVWRATIDAEGSGRLVFAFEGRAERTLAYRRIGVCVLHPWRAYVGATYEAATTGGTRRGMFPMRIAPQARVDARYLPMIEAFSRLGVAFPGGQGLELDLEGELFELEDQRNWTDASFKTYPTPLARSEPRTIRAGEQVRQQVTLRVRGTAPPAVAPTVPTVRIGAPTGRRVPPIGTSATSEPVEGAAHTRVELVAADPDPGALAHAAPVELALFVDPDAPEVSRVAPLLGGVALARVIVLRADGETTPGDLLEEVRARLGAALDGVPVVGGTSTSFSELNRNPPDGVQEGVAFAIDPQVHAVDERSLRETLEIQAQVLRQAGELAGARPIHVSPVVLTAYGEGPFADAWTAGSLATLIGAGAASITIDASSRAAGAFARLRNAATLEADVADPRRLAALGVEDARGRRALVVNLTGDRAPFVLNGVPQAALDPYEVRPAPIATPSGRSPSGA